MLDSVLLKIEFMGIPRWEVQSKELVHFTALRGYPLLGDDKAEACDVFSAGALEANDEHTKGAVEV